MFKYYVMIIIKAISLIITFKYIIISKGRKINIQKRIYRFIKYNKKTKINNADKNYLNSVKNYINLIEQRKVEKSYYIHNIKIINKFAKIDRRIKLIKNKINRGTLYSRIQGVLQSRGEYIIFIDSDDIVLK